MQTTVRKRHRALTPRWTPLLPHPEQKRLWHTNKRFCVVAAGRRSGKTEIAKRKLVKAALWFLKNPHPWWNRRLLFCAAPTRDQAKRIYWDDLKALIPKRFFSQPPKETDLIIYLSHGKVRVEIHVFGMDRPERLEGSPWDGGILDEYANMKEQAWDANIRPALSDRNGWCWLIGVPEGRNHYYKRFQDAVDPRNTDMWDRFSWTSMEIGHLDPRDIEDARNNMDPMTFQQEYEGSFVLFTGRAYYTYDESIHCKYNLQYNELEDLIFCFDFNVAPGVAVVCQEQVIPGQFDYEPGEDGYVRKLPVTGTAAIGEVYIPTNSNTPAVCRKLIDDWGDHEGNIHIYGDATGGARGTAKVEGSDWELIKQAMHKHFGPEKVFFHVPSGNPAERSRVNAVNSRLLASTGIARFALDPTHCKHLKEDLEGVRVLEGSAGEIDKKADPKLTHISDALGYYISRVFPVRDRKFKRVKVGNRY